MTNQIKFVCCCGEELCEKESLKEKIKTMTMYALNDQLQEDDIDCAAENVLTLFEEDRSAEPERWKPDINNNYWIVDNSFMGITPSCWNNDDLDNRIWKFGNYFKTREQAEQARDKIKEVLMNFHANDLQNS